MSSKESIQVGCVLMEQFSLVSFASANSVFNAFNNIVGERCYRSVLLANNPTVTSDSGVILGVNALLADARPESFDMLIICGGVPSMYPDDQSYIEWLKQGSTFNGLLAGLGTGGYCLCRAGQLNRRKASVHWFSLNQLRMTFPDVHFSTDLLSIDDARATCKGGTAATDLMLAIVAQQQGSEFLEAISQYFVKERIGFSGQDDKRLELDDALVKEQPKLAVAIELMESNIEEPLTTEDLAGHIGLSRRQLERLFKKYLKAVPSRYYLHIRLEKAREKLRTGSNSMTDIAIACGFSSAAHFSTAYRNLYGITPSEERELAS